MISIDTFLKSNLIYVTTGNDDPENIVETLRLCGPHNWRRPLKESRVDLNDHILFI